MKVIVVFCSLMMVSVVEGSLLNTPVTTAKFRCSSIGRRSNVQVSCKIPLEIKIVIFRMWEVNKSITYEVNVSRNLWHQKRVTVSRFHDSVELIKQSNEHNQTLVLKARITNALKTVNDTGTPDLSLRYALLDSSRSILSLGRIYTNNHMKFRRRRESSSPNTSGYLIFTNRLYLNRLSLDGNRTNVIVGGQEYATNIDVHVRNRSLFWIDSRRKTVFKSSLDGLKRGVVLNHGLAQPGGISVDWISNKLYWSDAYEEYIGVVDLSSSYSYKYTLLSTDPGFSPRGLVVDPTTRFIYWTEWNRNIARIQRASMDGTMNTILHQQNIQRPYSITIDYDDQVLYWGDFNLRQIERSNVNGSDRQVVVSTGIRQPFDITVLGNKLYISDWELGILATDKSGGQRVEIIYNSFCDSTEALGIQSIAEERQLLATNYCEEDGRHCSHLCLLSTDSDGYSCACPDGMSLDMDGFTCSMHSSVNTTTVVSNEGSCSSVGYTSCCSSGTCLGTPQYCFCDIDCYHFGDCCYDIEETCSSTQREGNAFVLLANILYIHRISTDGTRNKTLHSDAGRIIAIDYNYRSNQIYWSTSNENGLWRSELNGSGVISLLRDEVQTIDDIAVDWISNKLYWTNNGPFNGIGVLDLSTGYHRSLITTGQGNSPKAIVVDPLNRWLYWCEWGNIAKIERASMDGRNRSIIHATNLIEPIGLTLDYSQQLIFWIDAVRDKIESSSIDGSNRTVIANEGIFRPFDISLHRDTLYFTDTIAGLRKVGRSQGTIKDVVDSADFCEEVAGIEVVSAENQPDGSNPCEINNGGCSHLCLLSSVAASGYSCVCPDGFDYDIDDHQTCIPHSTTNPTVRTFEHGTCAAAGYTGRCCTSGTCRGSPPTCSCDFTCFVFQDCCEDVPPSCQPDIDVLEFTHVPINVTVILGAQTQPRSEFRCSVRSSRVTDFEWTFESLSPTPSIPSTLRQIADEIGSLDVKYSVASSDFTSILTIDNVQFSDAGNYICTASIGNRIEPIMATFIHTVKVPLSVPEVAGDHFITDRQAIYLRCKARVFPQPTVTWIVKTDMNIRVLFSNMSRISISDLSFSTENGYPTYESELVVNNITSGDSGDYTCVAVADKHTLTKGSHMINVTSTNQCQGSSLCLNGGTCVDYENGYWCLCLDNFIGRNCSKKINTNLPMRRPSFIESRLKTVINIDFGKPMNLTCLADGYPPPAYEWYKDGIRIPGEFNSYHYIPEALPDKRGNYSCKVVNSEGQIESDPIKVIIPGVIQYIALMENNQSETNISYEEVIANPLYLDRRGFVYSVEYLTYQSNMSEVQVLITLIMSQVPFSIKSSLVLELERIGSVRSLIRDDGCELADITELNIGEIFKTPCPCQEYLHDLLDGQSALRVCGGSYATGAQLQSTDFSQCTTASNFISGSLCQAAQTIGDSNYSLSQSQNVVNITASHNLQTSIDATLLSIIIEALTAQALLNSVIMENYLILADNFQALDRNILAISQSATNSSSRVLNSLEQLMFTIENNNNISTFLRKTFSATLVDVIPYDFEGQSFSVSIEGDVINDGIWSTIATTLSRETIPEHTVGTIYLSEQSLRECVFDNASQLRLVYFVFQTDSLFQSMNTQQRAATPVIAARANCSVGTLISNPINLAFSILEYSNQYHCASWMEDTWSTAQCRTKSLSQDFVMDKVECDCYHFSHFGVLVEETRSISLQLAIYVYFFILLSSVFLILTIVETKIRNSLRGVVTFNVCLTLLFTYLLFTIGSHITSLSVFCAISSGLLQYSLLVLVCWVTVLSILQYCHLSNQLKRKYNIIMKFVTILPLVLPLLIVCPSGIVWHEYYFTSYFCGVTKSPLWFGLVLPLGLIGVLHFILLVLLLTKVIYSSCFNSSEQHKGSLTRKFNCNAKDLITAVILTLLSCAVYSGCIFGLLFVHPRLKQHSEVLQVVFSVCVTSQGLLMFAYVLYFSDYARKFWISNFKILRTCSAFKSFMLCVRCKDSQQNINIPESVQDTSTICTNTNEAYESVMIRRKNERYTVTENEAYGQVGNRALYVNTPLSSV